MKVAVMVAAAVVAAGSSNAFTAPGSHTTGVVVVNTRLAYGGGGGSGTGIVLRSSGTVLTNNHVIRGAGSVRVTVPSTGKTYTATVAGYSVSKDVALLRLRGAAGLQTVRTGSASAVRVGDQVTAVGNSGGTGSLTAKRGRVTSLGESITVSDAGSSQTLVGLIETTAPLESGDSGGPLLARGRVIGIDTVASMSPYSGEGRRGYAIPIGRALKIASQIEAGQASSTVHVGPTAFLGVSLERWDYGDRPGALVGGVAAGSPAAKAGIGPSDLITSFAGVRVATADRLKGLVLRSAPGRTVRVTWIDPVTGRASATVRLVAGPPQ